MWGNALGWSISALLVVLTAGFVAWLDRTAKTGAARTPLSLKTENAAVIELPVAPNTVVHSMTSATDGGPIYRRAIDEYLKDPFTYGRFARAGRERDIETVPAINILLEATNCATADIFASSPSRIVHMRNEKPSLEALQTLGAGARRAGQLIEKTRPADAMKLYEATFALGSKLYHERLTYAELEAGLTLMAEGSAMIGLLDPSRAAATKQFDQARKDYVKDRILPMISAINSADQATLEKHAGDVLYFARSAPERMWRVEAIFSLGRYRFNAGRIADQRAATRVVRELSEDHDPIVRAAATAARDLTQEQYRMLR